MEEIAAGKGRAPKPFMLAKAGRGKADASGIPTAARRTRRAPKSKAATQADAGKGAKRKRRRPRRKKVARCRISSRRSSARSVERPPGGRRLVPRDQVRRLPHAAAGRGRRGRAETRKGLDWTAKFAAIAKAAARLPDASSTARSSRSIKRRAGFRGAAGRAVRRKTEHLIFFAFDLLFADGEDLRGAAACRAQGAPEAIAGSRARAKQS